MKNSTKTVKTASPTMIRKIRGAAVNAAIAMGISDSKAIHAAIKTAFVGMSEVSIHGVKAANTKGINTPKVTL
jgi:hypothetical protein